MQSGRFGVLVVDDYPPFRRMISSILEELEGVKVIGEASDGLAAIKRAEELQPDLILLDLGLPNLDGIETARRIHKRLPSTTIIFVTQETSFEIAQEALSAGAQGYVTKEDAWRDLIPAVKAVRKGGKFISSGLQHE